MGFLGHNFGSRYARRSSKSFINARDHLVFKNILSQNFGPWDWGPSKLVKKPKTPPTLRASPRRTLYRNQNIFFLIEPRSLSASVEGLNNSLAIVAGEL